jgi:hypothetical protein
VLDQAIVDAQAASITVADRLPAGG